MKSFHYCYHCLLPMIMSAGAHVCLWRQKKYLVNKTLKM